LDMSLIPLQERTLPNVSLNVTLTSSWVAIASWNQPSLLRSFYESSCELLSIQMRRQNHSHWMKGVVHHPRLREVTQSTRVSRPDLGYRVEQF
jgi:hypothetical protein